MTVVFGLLVISVSRLQHTPMPPYHVYKATSVFTRGCHSSNVELSLHEYTTTYNDKPTVHSRNPVIKKTAVG